MARYSKEHRDKTRAHLLETARREFRLHGFDALSIDKLTAAAGLTRGAFYVHFASKEALVSEVLEIEAGLLEALREAAGKRSKKELAAQAFEAYLDPEHRDELVQCPLVAHPMDARRGGPGRAERYAAQVASLVDAVTDVVGDSREDDAIAITVMAIGAAVLSSATDAPLAERVAGVARSEIRRRMKRR
ncbi:MAG: TetR family transcriptional regulator [Sandaracinaceae bacterium]